MFTDGAHAAIAVNAMSALCSALTIFLLYLTIVFFAKRLEGKPAENGEWSLSQTILICGSGAIGALAYCFSDTFWFSAVEGEVYAMSSLFTALVVWAMTRWYEQADTPYANRWILLISFLMGLSIGVHLLNLLTIPLLVFLYFYRKRENGHYTFWQYVGIFLLSVVIVGLLFSSSFRTFLRLQLTLTCSLSMCWASRTTAVRRSLWSRSSLSASGVHSRHTKKAKH